MIPPRIEFRQRADAPRPTWQCDIHEGIGHHGLGSTPAEALLNAAFAWCDQLAAAQTDREEP
jgi:hypothetical protein